MPTLYDQYGLSGAARQLSLSLGAIRQEFHTMAESYTECGNCGYRFPEPDIDKSGVRIKCPSCGSLSRNYHLVASEGIVLLDQYEIERIVTAATDEDIQAKFDIDLQIRNKTILECSSIVDARLIEYFNSHPEELKTMNRRTFEELVAELFKGFGYEVELTQQTHDGGKDIIAIKQSEVSVKYLIECKRPDPGGYVGVRPVRELLGIRIDELATKGILATTAYFSKDAIKLYEKHRWELELKDYDDLLEWIRKYLERR